MRRKGVLDRFRHTDTSSKNHADAPSSSVKLDDPISTSPLAAGSSAHNSQHISSQVPAWKLVPLPRHPAYPHHAVGIDDQVDRVIQLLEWENEGNVAVILHGFGGTGKTTLADAVVARLDIQGWNFSTLVAVPDESRHQGEMIQLQEEPEQASSFIYMDNVMVPGEHLQKLLPNNCKKLRLLVTARDEMVADVISGCGIRTHLYPVRPLPFHDARELLCNKMGVAGTMQIPQIKDILKICDGVPLVLERVGEYICQSLGKDEAYRRVIQWSKDGNAFSNAEEYRIEKNGLVLDLDELPASAKEPFLDICSFFNGWDWDKVSCIMGEDVLNTLQKKALLLKRGDCENKVTVRPIILTIGSMMTKGKRFTSVHDLNKVLEGSELDDIRGIKGIWLEDNISEPFLISAEKLDLMHESLRILALGDMTIVMGGQSCTQKFKQIIYFQAGLIPYIPFHPATLQELRFLDWLPDKNDDLQLAKMSSKLKVLILYGGRYPRRFETASIFGRLRGLKILKLIEFEKMKILHEELSLLTQLEELDLSGCGNLVQLPKRLGNLEALTKLSLRDCGSLQQLPDSFAKLQSLKCLDLHSCTSLEQLTQDFGSMKSLEELNLGEMSSLEELPSSFQKLSLLKVLNMDNCTSDLNHLPDNIRNLSLSVEIQVEGSRLVSIPPRFQQVKYSFPVSVSMADCSSLPREFCTYLKLVKDLSFRGCELLTNLPNQFVEFDSLTRLDLLYCKSLESLPEGFGQLKFLTELDLEGCSSLQQLSADFHCLASLQSLNMRWCEKLQGKWMDSVVKIKTLDSVDIGKSQMLLKRWAEIELENKMGQPPWRFIVRTGDKELKNVENVLNMAASKLLSGECLLTDSRGEPFSLSTVVPNTLLLVMYDEEHENAWESPWRLLEEIVKHEHSLIPFQIIYVGKYFGQLSQSFADRIMVCASHESEASLLLYKIQQVTSYSYPHLLVTEVVLDEGGHKHFSPWKNIRDSDEYFLSKSKLYADLHKLTQPSVEAESNVKLLRALFADDAESTSSSVFVRSYTENIGVDQLYGKTVLLLISVMDEHPFQSLTEIYSKVKSSSDDLEILSIPIPVEVRGQPLHRSKRQLENMELPESDLAGFESILRNVQWPVLRNPWLLKIAVYYFIEREWGVLNPGILVVVNPNGRICSKNALPLVETWGSKVLPFSEEKMKQLEEMKQVEQESVEELLSECILNGLLEK